MHYIRYSFLKNLHESEKFCLNFGGRYAFPKDPEHYKEIQKKISKVSLGAFSIICKRYIYTGFKRHNDEWIDTVTGAPLTWDNWEEGFPKEKSDYDCVIQNLRNGKIENANCNVETLCPYCEMREKDGQF